MIRLFAFGLPLTFRFLVPVEALKVCWCQTEEKLRNRSSSHPPDSNRKQSGLPGSSLRGCNRQEGIFPAALVKIRPQCQLCKLPLIIPIPEIHQELLVHSIMTCLMTWVYQGLCLVPSPHPVACIGCEFGRLALAQKSLWSPACSVKCLSGVLLKAQRMKAI